MYSVKFTLKVMCSYKLTERCKLFGYLLNIFFLQISETLLCLKIRNQAEQMHIQGEGGGWLWKFCLAGRVNILIFKGGFRGSLKV